MRILMVAVLCSWTCASAVERGGYLPDPDPVAAIATAMEASEVECLSPGTFEDEGMRFSYNLVSVRYLGTIQRGSEEFALGTAFFIRSSPEGHGSPPPRGHGYLLCLTPDYALVSFCELDFPDEVILSGSSLLRGEDRIADFDSSDRQTRRNGFLVDGSFLEYPFSDGLSDIEAL
ncbi:MAG: hypothetical protein JXA64_07380 [Candidatus Fermentibacteraceae bacterium]|nr:hypothetical protein [Candidatus Fermentibacteraceae bacterium]MBN2608922.1 hypothetical protein [Candidatus Fermentibacteraceae bacterium]